jgi:hypothetical protein
MTKPIVRIYLSNDEFIDREMNAAEFAQYKIDKADNEARQAENEAKATAKAAIADRLGLTADELKLLLG